MNKKEIEESEVGTARTMGQIMDGYDALERNGVVPKRYRKEDVQTAMIGGAMTIIGIWILYGIFVAEEMGTGSLVVGLIFGGVIVFAGIHSIRLALEEK